MQRLFSLFPHGGPGVGLMLLRVAGAVGSVYLGGAYDDLGIYIITCAIALALLLGLMTFWLALACCLAGLVKLYTGLATGVDLFSTVLVCLLSAGLMLLGPGAYSLDALLFGRRIVRIRD